MRRDDWDRIRQIVVESVQALFESNGLAARHDEPPSAYEASFPDAVSIIGFAGEQMRGSLTLGVARDALCQTHPLKSKDTDDLNDWLSELANLLLGRIKNRLLVHGVVVQMSIPVTLTGKQVTVETSTPNPVVNTFSTDGGSIVVVLDALAERGVQLASDAGDSGSHAIQSDPGEMVFL